MDRGMQQEKEVQHVYLVGAKSLGAYGGYETFVYKLTEYHQNKQNIKYHVACKANGDGCMDENKFEGVTKINDHEFELHNAHCFKIDVPQIGPAQAIYYDVAALKACCEHIKKNHIPHPIVYIMACRIGPLAGHFYVNDKFLDELEEKLHFKSDKRIKFVGTVYEQELLKKIRENAYAYFHGHTVGGTNPSLIEALGSTDLNLLVDVGFNKEVAEDCALYWSHKPGSLAKLIDKADQMNADEIAEMGQIAKKRVAKEYTWDKICRQYENVCISVKVEHNVGSSMYDVCSMEYWESAIEYITRTVENPLFFICSDNVEYVLRNLIDATKYDYVVQDKNVPVYVSLAVMSECKHFIIGNTTFGWWAQYMSQNPNKIVVAPSKWMAVDMPIDLYENNWHLIEV